MTNTILYITLVLVLAVSFGGPAGADLAAISVPEEAETGFPAWVQDANDLQIQPCSVVNPVDEGGEIANGPPCIGTELINPNGLFAAGNIAEFSYYRAEAEMSTTFGDFRLRLQVQGADLGNEPGGPGPGDPANSVIGNEVLIRARALTAFGDHTFVTPMGTFSINANAADCSQGGDGLIDCRDQAFNDTLGTQPNDFAETLTGAVMTYMTNGTGGEINPLGDGIFIGDFTTPAPLVQGNHPLPPGAELVFRATGPGPGNPTAETADFLVEGFLFNCDTNVPPLTNDDIFGVLAGASAAGNVLANDLDDPLATAPAPNPRILKSTIAIGTPPARGTATPNADGTVTYTHTGIAGIDAFTYTVRDACFVNSTADPGNSLSLSATAQVIAEDIGMKAVFRPQFMDWEISGNSSSDGFAQPTGTAGQTMLHTVLLGAQEVPAVVTAGGGSFTMTLDETAQTIDYTLNLSGQFSSAVTQAHIHTGAAGTNGPVNFFLCADPGLTPPAGTPACPQPGGVVTGSLEAADLIAAGGVDTFGAAAAGILAGNAYVNVHTLNNAGGEIRGQLGTNVMSLYAGADGTGPVIGTAVVIDGSWSFASKTLATPGINRMISCVSSNGVLLPNQELQIR